MPTSPTRVVVLALPTVVPFDLGVPLQVFGYPFPGRAARPYRVEVCGLRRGRVPTTRGFELTVAFGLERLRRADLVVIPGIDDTERPIPDAVCRALRAAYARGARLMSICTGAFALAAAGLLDDRRATTHWLDAAELATRYPRVRVDPQVLYVDEGRILTSAGIAAGIDLCLHVLRRDHGAALANAVARRLVVPPHRSGGQAQFIPEPVAHPQGDSLERTRGWMLERLGDPLTVAAMAAHAGLSVRTFARRFAQETGSAPMRWLLRQRVLRAQQLLETTTASIERIARGVGFGAAVSLRTQFQRALRTSPAAYRRSFRARAGA